MIHELTKNNSIANQFMAELRDQSIQKDRLRFRKNMERLSYILGYEISKTFHYSAKTVSTPLGTAEMQLPRENLVIASILRAGLSMHQGFLDIFDHAENAFVSAYREETVDDTVSVKVEYKACPDLDEKTLIIVDPMLATGQSLELVYQALLENGQPKKVIIASVIASQQAIEHLLKVLPHETNIWVVAIDKELNEKVYIVPGLGDAGDLAYGVKRAE
jgi:uracil phosphoribosyltransferase